MSHDVYYLPIHWIYSGFLSRCSPSPCLLRSPAVSPPCCIQQSEVALQEKPQVFLLMPFGWGKAVTDEIQAGKVGEKWTESAAPLCACLCHEVLQSSWTYFQETLFTFWFQCSSQTAWDFKQAGGFWYTASSFPPESPVTAPDWSHWDEIAKAEKFRGSPSHQVNRHPRVAGLTTSPGPISVMWPFVPLLWFSLGRFMNPV